ncbi:hypothetical protein AB0J80_33330 [Actinoplanes sp. NPDC049548]|uniref:hypothetical protein n=1 Tax=Actinoplanes sp. NPDC049548 TaxID=3155152 RepID=UPI003434BA85
MTDKDGRDLRDSADGHTPAEASVATEHMQSLIEGKIEELQADEKRAGHDDRPPGKRKAFRGPADLDVVYIGAVTLDQIVATRYKLQAHSTDISDEAYQRLAEALQNLQLEYGRYGSGYVLDNYLCRYIPAGVAIKIVRRPGLYARLASLITFQGRYLDQIDLSYLPEAARTTDPALEAAIWDCKRIYLQALRCRARRRS